MRADIAGGLPTPAWVQPLLDPFGRNPFGENIFRVVHSPRRVFLVGGYWEQEGTFGYRRAPRYPRKNCWILERWLPGRHYGSPDTWAQDTINPEGYLSLGPYPSCGLYECCFMFAARTPLIQGVLMNIVKSIYIGRVRTVSDIREQLAAETKAEEIAWDKQFEEDYDSTHGTRRGLSVSGTSTLVNYQNDLDRYKERLVASGVRLKRKDFKEGFQQFENATKP